MKQCSLRRLSLTVFRQTVPYLILTTSLELPKRGQLRHSIKVYVTYVLTIHFYPQKVVWSRRARSPTIIFVCVMYPHHSSFIISKIQPLTTNHISRVQQAPSYKQPPRSSEHGGGLLPADQRHTKRPPPYYVTNLSLNC